MKEPGREGSITRQGEGPEGPGKERNDLIERKGEAEERS